MSQTRRPPKGTVREFETSDDEIVELQVLDYVDSRIRIEIRTGPRWWLDIDSDGSVDILTSYDENRNLTDIPLPE